MNNAILLLSCPDRKGIVAKISDFIYVNDGNIVHADQHIDEQTKTLFMRIEWSLGKFKIAKDKIAQALTPLAKEFSFQYELHFSNNIPRVAIFVSSHLHCLYDILFRYQARQLKCHIPLVIGNHKEAEKIAKMFKVNFIESPKNSSNKKQAENKEISILKKEKIDLIVLARYLQILTPEFIKEFPDRIINIHHSFLPAFVGRDPYKQAYYRGVKIIGATSHYVIKELDAGPIIEQDTVRVSHRDSLDDLKRKGEDLEKVVLNRAIRWHLERKILTYNNKTVIFD